MRINIEDSLWTDPRFQNLLIKVGNRHAAKGMILELWTVAQKFWLTSGGLGIPKPAWVEHGLPDDLITCGLARDNGDFIYAAGSKEQFSWINQRSEAGRENKGKSNERRRTESNEMKRKPSKRVPPSPSPSPSPSLTQSPSLFSKGDVSDGSSTEIKSPVGLFISTYCKAYGNRYPGGRPDLRGKIQGLIKTFVNETPIERACELIQTYCEMNDQWFLTKAHDFVTFTENMSKVGLKLDTGLQVTRQEAQHTEHKQTVINAFGKLLEAK